MAKYNQEYYLRNKERCLAQMRAWNELNKDRRNEYGRKLYYGDDPVPPRKYSIVNDFFHPLQKFGKSALPIWNIIEQCRLTPKQLQCLSYLRIGMPLTEIAARLHDSQAGISHTISGHVTYGRPSKRKSGGILNRIRKYGQVRLRELHSTYTNNSLLRKIVGQLLDHLATLVPRARRKRSLEQAALAQFYNRSLAIIARWYDAQKKIFMVPLHNHKKRIAISLDTFEHYFPLLAGIFILKYLK